MSQGPWSCPQRGRKSPALPATPATTTATTPPVCRAHLEPTQMAPTVNIMKYSIQSQDVSCIRSIHHSKILKVDNPSWKEELCADEMFYQGGKLSLLYINETFVCVPACTECPAGTEPVLGYEYKWWNVLPSNMKTSCFNVGNSKCDDMNGESSNNSLLSHKYTCMCVCIYILKSCF